MSLDTYLLELAEDYFGDEDEAADFCDSSVYSNELAYKLYFGDLDIKPKLVDFNGQCHPESPRVFFNRGEENLYFVENYDTLLDDFAISEASYDEDDALAPTDDDIY